MRQTFQVRFIEAMNRSNMKAVDLANATGIPKSAISTYMNGKSDPKPDRLKLIAKALDVSDAWLSGYDVDMARKVEQAEVDQVGLIVSRIRKEKDFRQLIIKISKLKSDSLELISKLVDAILR